jgi:putative flippase GtrA
VTRPGDRIAPDGANHPRARVERLADALVPRKLHGYREQIQYLAVGAWNTLFGYLNFVLLYYLLGKSLPVAVILVASYVISVANAYICYRYIVFRSRGIVWKEIPRFSSVYLIALAANLIVLPVALRTLPVNAYVIQALFTICVVLLSYVGHKHVSFRGGQVNAAEDETTPEDPDSRGA